MRLGEGVEWAIHCCTILAFVPPEASVPGARLAEFHGVPAAYLAKSMQALTRAGITEALPGRRGGYRLAKAPADISLLDVVHAVEGDQPAFRCTEIRRRGPARVAAKSYAPVCGVAAAMWRAEEAWQAELRATSIADLVGGLLQTVPAEAATKTVTWMQEVLG